MNQNHVILILKREGVNVTDWRLLNEDQLTVTYQSLFVGGGGMFNARVPWTF